MIEFKIKGMVAERDIVQLRKSYPNFYYEDSGDFVVAKRDLDNHSYYDWIEVTGEVSVRVSHDIKWELFEKLSQTEKIDVTLSHGLVIKILPATSMPRKIVFGKVTRLEDNKEQYSTLAFSFYQKLKAKVDVLFDEEFYKFIQLALVNSYDLPIEAINYMDITSADLDTIFYAAVGIDQKKT